MEALARALDGLGLDGRRLRWRWERRRRQIAEAGARTEVALRGARGQHKMCPACRALVPRTVSTCPDCGASMGAVRAPGAGRTLSNLLPGITAATSLIMLVNGFWFVMMLMAQLRTGGIDGLGLFSAFHPEILVRFGSGLSFPAALADGTVTGGEWWRVITPIFLHGSVLHFFFNSYMLMNLGPLVEEIYGTERFWTAYLMCGIAGSWLSQQRPVNTVGASGAIMGLIGLLLVYGLRRRTVLGEEMKRLLRRLLIFFVILSVLGGGMGRIDHLNHLGGFACGAILGVVLPDRPFSTRAQSIAWQLASLAGVLLVLLSFYRVSGAGLDFGLTR